MAVQTYCTRADIEGIIGPVSVLTGIDRNQDGVESIDEEALIDKAISNAAIKINNLVRHQYKLINVAGNEYLKYANAVFALQAIRGLGGNPAEEPVSIEYAEILNILTEVRWGRDQLPEQVPSFNYLPATSSLQPQLSNRESPIVVNQDQSTGGLPTSGRRRITSSYWGYY